MPQVKCFNLDNEPKGYNPDIELNNVTQIFRSHADKGPIYIRFVVKNPMPVKSYTIDVYWAFDGFEEQIHNYELVTKEFKNLSGLAERPPL